MPAREGREEKGRLARLLDPFDKLRGKGYAGFLPQKPFRPATPRQFTLSAVTFYPHARGKSTKRDSRGLWQFTTLTPKTLLDDKVAGEHEKGGGRPPRWPRAGRGISSLACCRPGYPESLAKRWQKGCTIGKRGLLSPNKQPIFRKKKGEEKGRKRRMLSPALPFDRPSEKKIFFLVAKTHNQPCGASLGRFSTSRRKKMNESQLLDKYECFHIGLSALRGKNRGRENTDLSALCAGALSVGEHHPAAGRRRLFVFFFSLFQLSFSTNGKAKEEEEER